MFKKRIFLSTVLIYLLAHSVHAMKKPQAVSTDTRVKQVAYHASEVYEVVGTYGYQTSIEFSNEETIKVVSLGDSIAWQTVPYQNRLFLKPVEPNAATNLTVITDKRTYYFKLVSAKNKGIATYLVKFFYPNSNTGMFNTTSSASMASNKLDLNKLNLDYGFSGDKTAIPLKKVFDDGQFTYFLFDDKAEIPSIYTVGTDGTESIVNTRREGQYLVVERTASLFTLRNGAKHFAFRITPIPINVLLPQLIRVRAVSTSEAVNNTKTEMPSREEREKSVQEWENIKPASLVADNLHKKSGGVAFIIGTAAALFLVWYAKQPSAEQTKTSNETELTIADRKPVPKLKDLPAAEVPPVTNTPSSPTPATTQNNDPLKVQREQLEMQKREQARKMLEARLKSAIISPNTANQTPVSTQSTEGNEQNQATTPGLLGNTHSEAGAQDANSRFARSVSGSGVEVSKASQIEHLDYKILQGKIIEAVLEPRAVSDLPGMVCATVQRDVYGAQGRNKLIPWGSRVCGVYSAELRKGQERLFVIWNTLRRPDGVQVTLDSIGADQLGTAGMGGTVDNHFSQIFGMSALLSIIGAGAANAGVTSNDQYNSESYYRQSVQQAAAQTSQHVLQPYINIQPTVIVPEGSRVRIYVKKDLDFTSIYKNEVDASKQADVTFLQ